MRFCSFIIALIAALAVASSVSAQMMINADELFAYNKDMPLFEKREFLSENAMYKLFRIEYSSANAQRVPGWLTLPVKGEGPFPVVIVGHGAEGSKQDFETLYGFLATRGYACVAIDAQYHGDRKVDGKKLFTSRWYEMREIMVQTVIDLQRSIDYIETLPEELDASRVAYYGISMGVLIGTPFIGIDERVKVAILLVGGGDFEVIMNDSKILPFVLLRNTSGLPVNEVAEKFAPVDPVNYIGRFSPRPLLMMNGKFDNVIPPSAAKALYEAAGDPKSIRWFDSGHIPPFDQVMNLSAKFLNATLKKMESEQLKKKEIEETTTYEPGDISLKAEVTAEMVADERIVTISATPDPVDPDLIVEAFFPTIEFYFDLYDDGHRGDEAAFDGVYSIKLPVETILEGILPESLYDCYIRVKTPAGKILAEEKAGNLMLR